MWLYGTREHERDDLMLAMNASNSNTPTLDRFGTDWTEYGRQGLVMPGSGCVDEMERMIQVLTRRSKNNLMLLSEGTLDPMCLVEELACRVVAGEVPGSLQDRRIIALDHVLMTARHFRSILAEVRENPHLLLVLDAYHSWVGGPPGLLDVSVLLVPALARGQVQLIASTTLEAYREFVERDSSLERRFQHLLVPLPKQATDR